MELKNKTHFRTLFIVYLTAGLIAFCNIELQGTTWVINTSDFQFSPPNLSVTVGDTVKWQWISGDHTTTSLTIPSGALSWDSPLSFSNQTFIYRVTVAGSYHYKCTPHFPAMLGDFTANPIGIIKLEGEVPKSFKLDQNFPNPFNPVTVIGFDVPARTNVSLVISDVLGKEVSVLVNDFLPAGNYEVSWDAAANVSGIYFFTLTAGEFTETKKMTLIK